MKFKLLYLFLLIIVLASGCLSNKSSAPVPANIPQGTFTGQFRRIHTNLKTGLRDTALANLQLVLNTTNGFKVTGDTSTLHAGSYGQCVLNQSYIQFYDVTYPATGTPAKAHLNGVYQYYYDGTVFQMLNNPADTLSLQYDMKKTSN